jgi:hypothetical protein
MSLLKTIFDISALLASEFLGKLFLGIGVTGIIGGSIFVPIILYNVFAAFDSSKDFAGLLTGIISAITFLLSLSLIILGISMLVWARKKL